MIKNIFVFLLISGTLISCDCTYQYGVFVKNSTGEDINITYKSLSGEKAGFETETVVKTGELKHIISTYDLETGEGCEGCKETHCNLVAEYVNAEIRDGILSTKKWCSDNIKFEKTDIQQAEFTIEYTLEDFEL